MPDPRPVFTYTVLAVGVASFAFSPVLVRLASEGPGLAVAVWRTLLAAALLAPAAAGRCGPAWRRLGRRDWALIVGAGMLLGLHFIAWIESLYHTTVASASVLVTTSPLFLALFGFVVLRERLSWVTTAAIATAVLGAALIGWGDATGDEAARAGWGNLLALTAAVLVSGYLLIGRVVRQHLSWLAYVFPLYAVAALTTCAAAWAGGTPLFEYSPAFYVLCFLMALGPQVLGHGSFNYALQFVPAALVGMLALLEPVGASLLAYALFDEVPTVPAVTGMVVILVSVLVVIRVRRRA